MDFDGNQKIDFKEFILYESFSNGAIQTIGDFLDGKIKNKKSDIPFI
jgi:hypothetical protein